MIYIRQLNHLPTCNLNINTEISKCAPNATHWCTMAFQSAQILFFVEQNITSKIMKIIISPQSALECIGTKKRSGRGWCFAYAPPILHAEDFARVQLVNCEESARSSDMGEACVENVNSRGNVWSLIIHFSDLQLENEIR